MAKAAAFQRFTNPDSVAHVDPPLLLRLLERYRVALTPFGIFTDSGIDEVAFNRMLAHLTPEVPDSLINEFGVIADVGSAANYERLRTTVIELDLEIPESPSAADLVVILLLDGPEALERIYAEQIPLARRKFRSYLALTDDPLPVKVVPDHVSEMLRVSLEEQFEALGRGRGVRVYPVSGEDGFRLMIRRGEAIQREATIDPISGDTKHIAFRPQRFDAIIYKAREGELQSNAKRDADVNPYLEAIGHYIFNDPTLFMGEGLPARYTLSPIVENGETCLTVGDVPELSGAWLTSVEWFHGKASGMFTRKRAPDVFRGLEVDGERIPRHVKLVTASFRLRFVDGRESPVRIVLPNNAVLGREADAEVILRWLTLRGFILGREVATNGLTRTLLASS